VPKPRRGELLIKVRSVGICGSDLHAYHGNQPFVKPPRILGHELAGDVWAIGEGAEKSGFEIGDKVVAEGLFTCGQCGFCRSGRYNICENARVLGIHVNGADAEFVNIPAEAIHHLPERMNYDEGALVEPAAVAAHAVERCGVGEDDVVAITGMGPIGLLTMQMAKARGASKIFVSDVIDYRLDLARKLGADLTVNARQEDWSRRVSQATNGRGADAVFEAVGHPDTIRETFEIVRHGGSVIVIGMSYAQPIMEMNMLSLPMKELRVLGSKASARMTDKVIELFRQGRVNFRDLVSHALPLAEAPRGFELCDKKRENAVKVILHP